MPLRAPRQAPREESESPDKASELEPVSGFEPLTCRLQGGFAGPRGSTTGHLSGPYALLAARGVHGRRHVSATVVSTALAAGLSIRQSTSRSRSGESSSRVHSSGVFHDRFACTGLFVPKPDRSVHCQRCGMPKLGTIVRPCPLASATGDGRRYSLGYSVPRRLLLDHLVCELQARARSGRARQVASVVYGCACERLCASVAVRSAVRTDA